jgi:hypothetical protein
VTANTANTANTADAVSCNVPEKVEEKNPIAYMQSLLEWCRGTGDYKSNNFWNNGGGKALMNVAGAGIGGAVLGIGTAQIMKSSNRSDFTAAQQEWMNDVGNHIRCYIGSDEVGVYSDIISTEME